MEGVSRGRRTCGGPCERARGYTHLEDDERHQHKRHVERRGRLGVAVQPLALVPADGALLPALGRVRHACRARHAAGAAAADWQRRGVAAEARARRRRLSLATTVTVVTEVAPWLVGGRRSAAGGEALDRPDGVDEDHCVEEQLQRRRECHRRHLHGQRVGGGILVRTCARRGRSKEGQEHPKGGRGRSTWPKRADTRLIACVAIALAR